MYSENVEVSKFRSFEVSKFLHFKVSKYLGKNEIAKKTVFRIFKVPKFQVPKGKSSKK